MHNEVLESAPIKSVVANGRKVLVKYATKPESWNRPYLSTAVQDRHASAIEKADIPRGATVAIMT